MVVPLPVHLAVHVTRIATKPAKPDLYVLLTPMAALAASTRIQLFVTTIAMTQERVPVERKKTIILSLVARKAGTMLEVVRVIPVMIPNINSVASVLKTTSSVDRAIRRGRAILTILGWLTQKL